MPCCPQVLAGKARETRLRPFGPHWSAGGGVRLSVTLLSLCVALLAALPAAPARADAAACPETPTIAVPTAGGPAYGTLQYARTVNLGPKQVALTFDDGPSPDVTPLILDILDQHCVKATFFMVGIYAEKHPDIVRDVAARGHTIATHTWSHPNNLRHLPLSNAQREIRRGFEAVESALASAPADARARLMPFFRFPGLNDSQPLMRWLGERNIATLSCEFGADDWRTISASEVRRRAMRNIRSVGSGILILHDTKPRTASMLSSLVTSLRAEGYELVQLVGQEGARELAFNVPDPLLRPDGDKAAEEAIQSARLRPAASPLIEP